MFFEILDFFSPSYEPGYDWPTSVWERRRYAIPSHQNIPSPETIDIVQGIDIQSQERKLVDICSKALYQMKGSSTEVNVPEGISEKAIKRVISRLEKQKWKVDNIEGAFRKLLISKP